MSKGFGRKTVLFLTAVFCIAMFANVATAQVVPVVPDTVKKAASTIDNDTKMKAVKAALMNEENTTQRFIDHMEITRIASPSRQELHRMAELHKRFKEWGFTDSEIKTTATGFMPGAGLQTVDGLPVYNACIEIKGSYRDNPNAVKYKGQYPKVLIEGHIDTVNPSALKDLKTIQFEPVKLQPMTEAVITTPAQLAAIPMELKFDAKGKLVKDETFKKVYKRFDNEELAKAGGGYRFYVPGYADAMVNTVNVMYIAKYIKQFNIKPVYDLWICGTAGEEGRGNLAGMKQLYGYSQDAGKGNNALNFVANFSIDGGGNTVNYLGSYRFEVKYTAPAKKSGDKTPLVTNAIAYALADIADVKTNWDADNKTPKTTYTVGVVTCSEPTKDGVEACSFEIDMRAPSNEYLNPIRAKLEPMFQQGATQENRRVGVNDDKAPTAIKVSIEWFGDRPAHVRNLSDVKNLDSAIYAAWQSAVHTGADLPKSIPVRSGSLNDNVPAATGVPTINISSSSDMSGGGHAFWEWGAPGNSADTANKTYRILMAALIAAGYTADNGSGPVIVAPLAQSEPTKEWPLRTTEELFK